MENMEKERRIDKVKFLQREWILNTKEKSSMMQDRGGDMSSQLEEEVPPYRRDIDKSSQLKEESCLARWSNHLEEKKTTGVTVHTSKGCLEVKAKISEIESCLKNENLIPKRILAHEKEGPR